MGANDLVLFEWIALRAPELAFAARSFRYGTVQGCSSQRPSRRALSQTLQRFTLQPHVPVVQIAHADGLIEADGGALLLDEEFHPHPARSTAVRATAPMSACAAPVRRSSERT